jgi:protein-disulfide isomerase
MTTRKKRRRQERQGISTRYIVIIAVVAVLVVVLLVVLNSNLSTSATVRDLSYPTGVTSEGEPYKGSPEAPLQLVEYSDFLCSHCRNFADTLNTIGPDYIETGKLQVVFRNYAFLMPESNQAAQAGECALDQGADKFWQYHDLLFANQGAGLAAYSSSRLETYARQVGLDVSAFDSCLQSGAKADEVSTDLEAGNNQGVSATPTWFLNGQIVEGALPETNLRQLLDSQLSGGS